MASSVLGARFTSFATEVPAIISRTASLREIFEEHQSRIYNLAFYLTDNEVTAETICERTFSDVFAINRTPSAETLDRALVNVLRETMEIGTVSLDMPTVTEASNARRNVKRAVLERAVMQVPATERMIFLMHDVEGYDHSKIARILGISTDESRNGLHQARLAVRQAAAEIQY